MKTVLSAILAAAGLSTGAAQAPFTLSDSDPGGPEFRRRFMASYGVNAAIEPKLTVADRPLQQAILPHLRSNPREAIRLIQNALRPDTNPAFLSILGNLQKNETHEKGTLTEKLAGIWGQENRA